MSSAARKGASAGPSWDRLELAARRLIQEHAATRRRLADAERRVGELERTLSEVSQGTLDPVALHDRLERASAQNEALRGRLAEAETRVQRILLRLQFLEEEQ